MRIDLDGAKSAALSGLWRSNVAAPLAGPAGRLEAARAMGYASAVADVLDALGVEFWTRPGGRNVMGELHVPGGEAVEF